MGQQHPNQHQVFKKKEKNRTNYAKHKNKGKETIKDNNPQVPDSRDDGKEQ